MSSDLERAAQVCEQAAAHRWDSMTCQHIAVCIRALAPAQPEGWVSVKDRLPADEGWYAVIVSDPEDIGWDTDTWWRCQWSGGKWNSCDPVDDGQPVTHWMALPSPPPAETAGDIEKRVEESVDRIFAEADGLIRAEEVAAGQNTDGRSGLSTSPSNEGDAGRPGQTDSSVPRDTLPEEPYIHEFEHRNINSVNTLKYVYKSAYDTLRQSAARLQAELEEARMLSSTKVTEIGVLYFGEDSDLLEPALRDLGITVVDVK